MNYRQTSDVDDEKGYLDGNAGERLLQHRGRAALMKPGYPINNEH
jgi:hypothetical protein